MQINNFKFKRTLKKTKKIYHISNILPTIHLAGQQNNFKVIFSVLHSGELRSFAFVGQNTPTQHSQEERVKKGRKSERERSQ